MSCAEGVFGIVILTWFLRCGTMRKRELERTHIHLPEPLQVVMTSLWGQQESA